MGTSEGNRLVGLLKAGLQLAGGLLLVACSNDVPVPVIGGVEFAGSVQVDGREHKYLLFAPNAQALDDDVPLVVSLHGGGGTMVGYDSFTQIRLNAVRHNYAVLTPAGYERTWNAGSCCAPATTAGIDHVQVIRAMVDDAARSINVDRSRVYAEGHSNGGMLAYRLACEAADIFAAIAPVSAFMMNRDLDAVPAQELYACNPSRAVPVMHVHGLADTCAPYAGGPSTGPAGGTRPPVSDSIDFWVTNNRCLLPPILASYSNGGARCEAYSGCQGAAQVQLCTIEDGGHVWPGTGQNPVAGTCGGEGVTSLDANEQVWEFFRSYSL